MHRSLLVLALTLAAGCRSTAPQARTTARGESIETACRSTAPERGLELIVLGSGGPHSAGRAASSYAIALAGKPRVLVDVGSGAFTRLGESDLATDALDTVFLTHLHVDHAGDLPDYVKSRVVSADRALGLRVYGPDGRGEYPSTSTFVERLFGDHGAFAYLTTFGKELKLAATNLSIDATDSAREISNDEGLRVSYVPVDHGDAPAVAYRIEHEDRSIVISGDLAASDGAIVSLARNASVLVYDAAVLDPPKSPAKLYALHTPPRRIGEIAARAGVGTLILSHIAPATERDEDEVLASVRASFPGRVRFAHDCMRVSAQAAKRADTTLIEK